MTAKRRKTRAWALVEVAAICAAYIGLAYAGVSAIDLTSVMPLVLTPREALVGSVFLVGALTQLSFVLAAGALYPAIRAAIASTMQRAPGEAWIIALTAAAIQCAAVIIFFLPDPSQVLEASPRHAALFLLPLADGWSQEVIFRGYVVLRLSRAGLPVALQIAISALAFAAIHLGYIGSEGLGVIWPLIGTTTLGAFLAWSVVRGGGSILPACIAHILILVVVQPWLALAS